MTADRVRGWPSNKCNDNHHFAATLSKNCWLTIRAANFKTEGARHFLNPRLEKSRRPKEQVRATLSSYVTRHLLVAPAFDDPSQFRRWTFTP